MDKNVFDIWHKDYSFILFLKAKKIIGDSHAAEDIVQNTFVSALKSIDSFDDRCNPFTLARVYIETKSDRLY
jgi:DNA-directed RNA polymerase specialized sigma24 family protein